MTLFRFSIINILFLMTLSCGDNKSNSNKVIDDCSQISFYDEILSHKNIVAINSCFRLESDYPYLTKAIASFSSEKWNQLIKILSNSVDINNSRENLISLINDFSSPAGEQIKDELFKIYHDLKTNSEFIKFLSSTMGANEQVLPIIFEEIILSIIQDDNFYKKLKNLFLDASLNDSSEILQIQDISVIGLVDWNILKKIAKDNQYKDISEYFFKLSLQKDEYLNHLKIIHRISNSSLACSINGSDFVLDAKLHIKELFEEINNSNASMTLEIINDQLVKLFVFHLTCIDRLENENFFESSKWILNFFSKLMVNDSSINITKFVISLVFQSDDMFNKYIEILSSQFFNDFLNELQLNEKFFRSFESLLSGIFQKIASVETTQSLNNEFGFWLFDLNFTSWFARKIGELHLYKINELTIIKKILLDLSEKGLIEGNSHLIQDFDFFLENQKIRDELKRYLSKDGLGKILNLTEIELINHFEFNVKSKISVQNPRFEKSCMLSQSEIRFSNLWNTDVLKYCRSENFFLPSVFGDLLIFLNRETQNANHISYLLNFFLSESFFDYLVKMILIFDSSLVKTENYVEEVYQTFKFFFENADVRDSIRLYTGFTSEFLDYLPLFKIGRNVLFELEKNEFSLGYNKDISVDGENKELCHSLNLEINSKGCLSKQEFSKLINDLSKILLNKANTNYNKNLLSTLANLFFNDYQQIRDLNGKKVYRSFSRIQISKLVEMFKFLNSKGSVRNVVFNNESEYKFHEMTHAEKIEVLIREMGFNDSFYTIYFINEASSFYNFNEKMYDLRKQLRLMIGSSGVFRRLGYLDRDSQWRFKNVWNVYDVLFDISKSPNDFSDIFQSILYSTVESSPLPLRSFHPYRAPSINFVSGHGGELLILLANHDFFTRSSQFSEKYFSNDLPIKIDKIVNKLLPFEKEIISLLESILSNSSTINLLSTILFDLSELPSQELNFVLSYFVSIFENIDYSKFDSSFFVFLNKLILDKNIQFYFEKISIDGLKIFDKLKSINPKIFTIVINELLPYSHDANQLLDNEELLKKSLNVFQKILSDFEKVNETNFFDLLRDQSFDYTILSDFILNTPDEDLILLEIAIKNIFKVDAHTNRNILDDAIDSLFNKDQLMINFLKEIFQKIRFQTK